MVDLHELSLKIIRFSSHPLFTLAGTQVTLLSIFIFFFIILVSGVISVLLRRALSRTLARQFAQKEGTLAALLRLVHYVVLIIGFGIALQTIGINISALFAAGAVFAIAIGFAMQNIAQNFVSGIIMLVERSIKPGDIIEVEGAVVKVVEIGIRTTVVRTLRDEDLILPNSIFSQSAVKNFTLYDKQFRIGINVGVSYESNIKHVIAVLDTITDGIPWRIKNLEPRILLEDFGESAVLFGIYVHIDDPWKQRVYMSELRKVVWFAFQDEQITIAYNQLDIHLDPPVVEHLSYLKKAA